MSDQEGEPVLEDYANNNDANPGSGKISTLALMRMMTTFNIGPTTQADARGYANSPSGIRQLKNLLIPPISASRQIMLVLIQKSVPSAVLNINKMRSSWKFCPVVTFSTNHA